MAKIKAIPKIDLQQKGQAWFKKVVLGFATNATLLQSQGIGKVIGVPRLGRPTFHWYDPKLKDVLPYYDRFPLTIPLNYYDDGYLGLNLHYLPPGARLSFFEELAEYENRKGSFDTFKSALLRDYGRTNVLGITYPKLKQAIQLDAYKVCIKRYLFSHVRSPFLDLDPKYWEDVVMLPVQRFAKGKPW